MDCAIASQNQQVLLEQLTLSYSVPTTATTTTITNSGKCKVKNK
jgi:hypothetical protein